MRKYIAFILCIILLLLTGCGKNENVKNGQEYLCEKPGFGFGSASAFTLTLFDDGTYMYYEGPLSSFLGYGEYEKNDSIITIYTDIPAESGAIGRINKFAMEGNRLRWIEDGSDNFSAVTLSDGIYFNYNRDVMDIIEGASHSYFPSVVVLETTE